MLHTILQDLEHAIMQDIELPAVPKAALNGI